MSPFVFLALLAAAAVHAGWNALIKTSDDKAATTALVGVGAGLIGLAVLPFVAVPAPESRPWLVASVAFQVGYMALIARTYRHADLSLAYPLMRGTAPLLVAGASVWIFAEPLGPGAWTGVALISAGVVGLVFAGYGQRRGVGIALLNAGFIAAYTILDGRGVRLSGSPPGYVAWSACVTALPLLVWATATRGRDLLGDFAGRGLLALTGGAATLFSYGIALWAMTRAPVAMVAALRETSIVFALLLGRRIFGETLGAPRLVAIAVVVTGILVLRIA